MISSSQYIHQTKVTKIRATLADDDSTLGLVTVNFASQPELKPRVKEATVFDSKFAATNVDVGDAVSLGEEGAGVPPARIAANNGQNEKMDVDTDERPIDETRIFFIPTPKCTQWSLFRDFSKFGWMDHIYTAKARNSHKRFGYARYVDNRAAKAALNSPELSGYHCKAGKQISASRREREDPDFQRTTLCGNCFLSVDTITIERHYDICEWQQAMLDGKITRVAENEQGVYVSHGLTYQTMDPAVALQGGLNIGDPSENDVSMAESTLDSNTTCTWVC